MSAVSSDFRLEQSKKSAKVCRQRGICIVAKASNYRSLKLFGAVGDELTPCIAVTVFRKGSPDPIGTFDQNVKPHEHALEVDNSFVNSLRHLRQLRVAGFREAEFTDFGIDTFCAFHHFIEKVFDLDFFGLYVYREAFWNFVRIFWGENAPLLRSRNKCIDAVDLRVPRLCASLDVKEMLRCLQVVLRVLDLSLPSDGPQSDEANGQSGYCGRPAAECREPLTKLTGSKSRQPQAADYTYEERKSRARDNGDPVVYSRGFHARSLAQPDGLGEAA